MLSRSRALVGTVLLTLGSVMPAAADTAADWGIVFPTSQTGEAQRHFLDGVTAMHLHMFEDAEAHFQAARRVAPDFAMAYWGEALNQHRAIWGYHEREKALAVLNKLGPTSEARAAKAPTAREKAYLHAVEVLFGDGPQNRRVAAYEGAMRGITEAYPDDTEAWAWHSLSLMSATMPGMTREQTRVQMAADALRVLSRNRRHPGANRYLIQSTNDTLHMPMGLIAVENLKTVTFATQSSEILHIPSHTYLAYGMWKDAAEANMRAFDVSMAWTKAHGWGLADLNLHNYGHLLDYATLAYLQTGQFSKVAALERRVMSDYEASGKAAEIRRYMSTVHARSMVERQAVDSAQSLAALARRDGIPDQTLWLGIGVTAARANDLALAREALEKLQRGGGETKAPALKVKGLIAMAEGQQARGVELLGEAAGLEAKEPSARVGLPPPVALAAELYGQALVDAGRPQEALKQFESALAFYRRTTNLLLGAAKASQQAGQPDKAAAYARDLLDVLREADAGHPFLSQARQIASR